MEALFWAATPTLNTVHPMEEQVGPGHTPNSHMVTSSAHIVNQSVHLVFPMPTLNTVHPMEKPMRGHTPTACLVTRYFDIYHKR